mgnify:CR=1 FL=1
MSITNMSLLAGPTISVTGGTTKTFSPDGTQVNRGIQVSDSSEPDIRTRDCVVFKNTNGSLQSDGSWSKDRRSAKIVSPDVMSDKSQDFPFIEISLVKSPLNDAAKLATLKEYAVQLLTDPDTAAFWVTGALN